MSVEKKLSLRGKAEWAGARKVLAALKRAHKIKGPVKLAGAPAPARRNGRVGDFIHDYKQRRAFERMVKQGSKRFGMTRDQYIAMMRRRLSTAPPEVRFARPNPKRARNIAGFMSGGVFHPIRSGERMITYRGKKVLVKDERPYLRKKAGEKARRRKANTSYASFMRQGRKRKPAKKNPKKLTKKQEFLRRMRLGRLRAARARNKSQR